MHILQALSIFINMRKAIFHLLISLLSSSMLADKLNMTPEEAERWIVNLIRNARLDAKLDSKLVRLHAWIQVASYLEALCSSLFFFAHEL